MPRTSRPAMQGLYVKLPAEQLAWVREEATRTGRSQGDLLRELIGREMAREGGDGRMACPACGAPLRLEMVS